MATKYLLPTLIAILFLQSCEQFGPKKTFYGKLSTPEGETLELGDGRPEYIAGDMQVELKSSPWNDALYSLSLQQGDKAAYKLPIDVRKPLVYGSFTLEPAEMRIQQRVEGNVQRRFVGDQYSSTQRKSCTYSGRCKHQVEKEEDVCSPKGLDKEKICTKTKRMVDVYGDYDSCPGLETFEITYQMVQYHLTLLFFDRSQDKTAAAIYEGVTSSVEEETSNVKTWKCNDVAY